MKETTKQREKRCPVCKKEYPDEDNYCGDDGSALEEALATGAKPHITIDRNRDDNVNAGPNGALTL
ncbi:MAG TPA: hypothetical protein VLM38_05295 [Blastocatellia bacterium]|nr:hypothetical protein [Blastocatellia bacterium]